MPPTDSGPENRGLTSAERSLLKTPTSFFAFPKSSNTDSLPSDWQVNSPPPELRQPPAASTRCEMFCDLDSSSTRWAAAGNGSPARTTAGANITTVPPGTAFFSEMFTDVPKSVPVEPSMMLASSPPVRAPLMMDTGEFSRTFSL